MNRNVIVIDEENTKIVMEKSENLILKYKEDGVNIIFKGTYTNPETKESVVSAFTPREIDLFYAILGVMLEENSNEVKIPNAFLKNYIGNKKNLSGDDFAESLFASQQKMKGVEFQVWTDSKYLSLSFFEGIGVDFDEQMFYARLSRPSEALLSDIREEYISFEMSELASLRRFSSKILYTKLKKYKTVGVYEVSKLDFETYMNASNLTASALKQKVINRAVEELGSGLRGKKIFKDLKYELIKDPNDNRRWNYIRFTFTPQLDTAKTIHISEQLQLDI